MPTATDFEPLIFWVIYDHPADYPDHFVVRRQFTGPDGRRFAESKAWLASTLEEARSFVPPHLYRQPHDAGQEAPCIAETWF